MAVSFVRVYQKYDRCRVEGDYFIRAFYKEVGVYANDLEVEIGEMSLKINPDMDLNGDNWYCVDEVRSIAEMHWDEESMNEWRNFSAEEKERLSL
tara:strand:+ start:1328 stop:1612 length:285 start_codon:yes stop_codon:yes gene_type:complete